MKKLIALLLAGMVCAGCLLSAFATEPTTAEATAAQSTTVRFDGTDHCVVDPPDEIPEITTTAAEVTTAPAEETTAPEPATAASDEVATETAQQPTTIPEFNEEGYDEWYTSEAGNYARWKGRFDDRVRYKREFRKFYADDPELTIVDHLVLLKNEATRYSKASYTLLDYFDTDEAEAAATTLRLPCEIDGLPVNFYFYCDSDYSAGVYDSGYTNDTVTKVILEEGFTGVPMFAFSNFTALKTVKIPASATAVGISAFQGCKQLKKIVGAENVTTVCSSAFAGCEKLAAFPHMEKLKTIEGSAFADCAFKSLTLYGSAWLSGGDEDHYSAMSAFGDNKKLKSVTFTDGSKKKNLTLGFGTFMGCTALKTVTFPKKCGGILIEDLAFKGCAALKTLNNVGKLSSIWRFAFEGCTALESFTLPAGIHSVSQDAFKGCKGLRTMTILSSDIDLLSRSIDSGTTYGSDDWNGVSSNFVNMLPKKCTVYVPTKEMKLVVKAHGAKGKVLVQVPVAAPKKLSASRKSDTVTLKWSKVKAADGYRLFLWNSKTKTFDKLKTVKAPTTTLTLKTAGKRFAVRAYRVVDGDVSWSKTVQS